MNKHKQLTPEQLQAAAQKTADERMQRKTQELAAYVGKHALRCQPYTYGWIIPFAAVLALRVEDYLNFMDFRAKNPQILPPGVISAALAASAGQETMSLP